MFREPGICLVGVDVCHFRAWDLLSASSVESQQCVCLLEPNQRSGMDPLPTC